MSKPRILVLDIETCPIEAYVWSLDQQNIPIDMVKKDFAIISFAGKFIGEKKVHQMDNRSKKDIRDDKALVKSIMELISTADVLVSQNGINFDLKKINSRAYFNHLPPADYPAKHVDLLLEGRRVFGHTSNKLAWITKALDSSHQKSKHAKYPGFDLWLGVMRGEKAAWNEMAEYNKQDVISTEAVYHDYVKWFPNVDLRPFYMAEIKTECRACGSNNTEKKDTRRNRVGLFQRYRCKDCGCVTQMKGAKNNLDKHPNGYKGKAK